MGQRIPLRPEGPAQINLRAERVRTKSGSPRIAFRGEVLVNNRLRHIRARDSASLHHKATELAKKMGAETWNVADFTFSRKITD